MEISDLETGMSFRTEHLEVGAQGLLPTSK